VSTEERIEQLRGLRREVEHGSAPRAAEGKPTARERLIALLDPGSFAEIDSLVRHHAHGFGIEKRRPAGDAVVTGWGTIEGRTTFVFSEDFACFGGSLGEAMGEKICKVMDLAVQNGAPLVGLKDSGGARIQEGVLALSAYGEIFRRNVRASGVIPQISVILGPCAGGAVYSPAITDFVFQVNGASHLFITGPDVIKAVTGQDIDFATLGGAQSHASISGVTHFVAADEPQAMEEIRYLLSFLPQNNTEAPPTFDPTDYPNRMEDGLAGIVPNSATQPYDMTEVVEMVVDDGDFYQVHRYWARNIVVGFARLDGHSVGIVGNNPSVLAGTLDIDASIKAARFVRFCDAFNIPLVTFVDVPGFLPGLNQEHGGIIRHGAKLLYAYCEATVPRLTVITRKGYGGACVVMNSRSVGADLALAWPTAEIAVMGAQGAVNIIYRRELEGAADPETLRAELVEDYERRFANPYVAAEHGLVDEVIEPQETRPRLIRGLAMLRGKRGSLPPKKHGNIPL
jgi:acetyl-CoA carboxylase carboxyltransferase component